MIDSSIRDMMVVFGPFLAAFFSWFVWIAFGHFLTKDRFRFEKLHTERAEAIKNIYSLMLVVFKDLELMVRAGNNYNPNSDRSEQEMDQKKEALWKSGNEFSNFLAKNRIFFSKSLSKKMEDLDKKLKHEVSNFHSIISEWEHIKNPEKLSKIINEIENKVPKLQKQLEEDFRKLLGIS